MSETLVRLKVAWYALRGWAVIHGVGVSDGDVYTGRRHVFIARGARLRDCHIRSDVGVILIHPGSGNTGQLAVAQSEREARWISRKLHRHERRG